MRVRNRELRQRRQRKKETIKAALKEATAQRLAGNVAKADKPKKEAAVKATKAPKAEKAVEAKPKKAPAKKKEAEAEPEAAAE